jgi:hypothetical protein
MIKHASALESSPLFPGTARGRYKVRICVAKFMARLTTGEKTDQVRTVVHSLEWIQTARESVSAGSQESEGFIQACSSNVTVF